MSKLITIKDSFPSADGCYSVVRYEYKIFKPIVKPFNNERNIIKVEDDIEILITKDSIEISKRMWVGLSREKLFTHPLFDFIDNLSNHPRFKYLPPPFPTLLESVTMIALENGKTTDFIRSIKGHLVGGRREKIREEKLIKKSVGN